MEKKKVLISGYYGFDNSGDDAILKAIVESFKNNSNNVEIVAFSNKPLDTKKKYNIKAVNRFHIGEIIKEIKSCNLFISGGGSLLQDVTSTRSIIYYITLMYIAKLFKKPIMVYANGIGPIRKKFNKFLTKRILNKVDLITLRDYDSKKFLEYLNIKNKNIYVTADPVFTLTPSHKERVFKIFENEKIPLDKNLIGISVRAWKGSSKLIEVIPKTIDYIITNYNVNVLIIPMHYPEDLDISQKIKEKVSKKGCYILSNKYDVEDIMGVIKKLKMIVAMRLHSLIYAATQEVPMIGIIYDPKIKGFLNFIDMKYMCNVEELEVVKLCTYIDEVWNNKKNLKDKLYKYDKEFKEKALQNVYMALNLLQRR